MSHQDYAPAARQLEGDFRLAEEALTQAALSALRGRITLAEAESAIDAIVGELAERSTGWALAVLPTVAEDAQEYVAERFGVALTSRASVRVRAMVELSTLNLSESLSNAAQQMGRDARFLLREGLQIKAEEAISA